MYLIVGLGNPGIAYVNTRHNVGFDVIDVLNEDYELGGFKSKFGAEISQGFINETKLILAKPQSFMNLSGGPVQAIRHYYKINNDKIIVIHDDLDLECGKVKIKRGGGSGGHNGIKSIDSAIGNSYFRIRIGIGKPERPHLVNNFVLEKFNAIEQDLIDTRIDLISEYFHFILEEKSDIFLNKIIPKK